MQRQHGKPDPERNAATPSLRRTTATTQEYRKNDGVEQDHELGTYQFRVHQRAARHGCGKQELHLGGCKRERAAVGTKYPPACR